MRGLTELQLLADAAMTSLQPGTPAVHLVAARAKEGLLEARAAVRTVLTGLRLGPLHQAMAIEGLRTDLEWLSTLVARLDEETPHPVSAWLDVELQRLRAWLGTAPGREPDPRDESLRAGCERMQALLLERRIERELARPSVGWSADGLWAERFHLSRLQTQVETLELEPSAEHRRERPAALARLAGCNVAPSWPPTPSIGSSSLELPSRAEACELIVQTAVDEVGETIAFLEDMPLRRAVKRLKLMRDDLERLAESCRRWSREPKIGGRSIVHGRYARGHRARTRKIVPEQSDDQDDQDQAAMERLRRQARRAERLARRVRAAWQEKLLALRMQTLFGHRFVAILENTVLVLILVLFVLIAAQVVLERTSPSGLSVRQHEFFAWTDLAICSVFLFEFALKLALAPNRMTYFARHFVIDLVASLPFGFVFHQIALATTRKRGRRDGSPVRSVPASHPCRASVSPVHQGGPADPPAGASAADPASALRSPGAPHGRAAQSQHRLVRAVANAKVRVERPPSSGDLAERARACEKRDRGPARSRPAPAARRACDSRPPGPDRRPAGCRDRRSGRRESRSRDSRRAGRRAA